AQGRAVHRAQRQGGGAEGGDGQGRGGDGAPGEQEGRERTARAAGHGAPSRDRVLIDTGRPRPRDLPAACYTLKKSIPSRSSAFWASTLRWKSSPVNTRTPMAISTTPAPTWLAAEWRLKNANERLAPLNATA